MLSQTISVPLLTHSLFLSLSLSLYPKQNNPEHLVSNTKLLPWQPSHIHSISQSLTIIQAINRAGLRLYWFGYTYFSTYKIFSSLLKFILVRLETSHTMILPPVLSVLCNSHMHSFFEYKLSLSLSLSLSFAFMTRPLSLSLYFITPTKLSLSYSLHSPSHSSLQ